MLLFLIFQLTRTTAECKVRDCNHMLRSVLEKLRVDIMLRLAVIRTVDICLLSFGYRVFGTAP